ncbi:GLPGLI family protein [Flavobacterium sp.]|uniref:GLPGLI family protein n=1 Tax=Flavobacterium sp. TaxID=239 RepID=UPI0039197440
MKKAAILLLLLNSIILYSQNKIVNIEYEILYNTDKPNTQKANLYVSEINGEALYKKELVRNSSKTEKEENNNLILKFNSKKTNCNYINLKKDSLLSVESIFGDEYLIKEKVPIIKWELTNEEKLIDTIKVSKAICSFRGRKYIAWYAPEYPIKFGPWKLHGLPGLIFEVSDETKRYNWFLKKITYQNYSKDAFTIDLDGLQQLII